jgi:hypothetical protein
VRHENNNKKGGKMTYKVHQIKIRDEIIDHVNGPEGGHAATAAKYPKYHAYLECQRGAEKFKPEYFKYFDEVCKIKEDAGMVIEEFGEEVKYVVDDCEEVFRVLNGLYYDEEKEKDEVYDNHVYDFDYMYVRGKRYRDMHSLSVGDIVEDPKGKFHMVEGFGFKEVLIEKEVA